MAHLKQIDLWIIEDNLDYRELLAEELNMDASIQCSQILGSFDEARELLKTETTPDLVLIDLNLPGTHGLDAIRELKQKHPMLLSLVLTISGQRKTVFEALRSGASGYLLKSESLVSIVRDIHEVVEGGVPLSSQVVPYVLDSIKTPATTAGDELALNEREVKILKLLADGKSRADIGIELSVATVTVDYHLRGLYAKLDVRSTTAAVAKAFRCGVLS